MPVEPTNSRNGFDPNYDGFRPIDSQKNPTEPLVQDCLDTPPMDGRLGGNALGDGGTKTMKNGLTQPVGLG